MTPRPTLVLSRNADHDDEEFARLRAGDAVACEALFNRYVDSLCGFAFAYTQSRESAEEIVQELFLWLWEHRSAIESPRSVPGYLHGAVRNRALNAVRDRVTELRIHEKEAEQGGASVLPASFDAPDALAEAHDLNDALARAVAEMPLRWVAKSFTLSRARHLTYAEIGVVLSLSPKTIEIYMSRALALLRERLAPWLAG